MCSSANHFLVASLETPHVTTEDWPLGPMEVHHYFLQQNDPFYHRPTPQSSVCVGVSWPSHRDTQRECGIGSFLGYCCTRHDRLLMTGPRWHVLMLTLEEQGLFVPDSKSVYDAGVRQGYRWHYEDVVWFHENHVHELGWFTEAELNDWLALQYDRSDFPPCL